MLVSSVVLFPTTLRGLLMFELGNEFGITIQLNTTAAGEDGCVIKLVVQHAVKLNLIRLGARDSIARNVVDYCNVHFRISKKDTIERYFYELDEKEIKVHQSPIKSLELGDCGISEYHCGVIKQGNKASFKKQSCFCNESIESNFNPDEDCASVTRVMVVLIVHL